MGLGRGPIGYPLTYWYSAFNMSSVTGKGSVGPCGGCAQGRLKGDRNSVSLYELPNHLAWGVCCIRVVQFSEEVCGKVA